MKKQSVKYEMILAWRTDKTPLQFQKLAFAVKTASMKRAFAEAQAIMRLLVSVGNFQPSDVRIQAIGLVGVLEDWQKETGIFVRKHKADMAKLVKEAKSINKKPAKKPTLVMVKNIPKPTSSTTFRARG